jgi:hypothetical protein
MISMAGLLSLTDMLDDSLPNVTNASPSAVFRGDPMRLPAFMLAAAAAADAVSEAESAVIGMSSAFNLWMIFGIAILVGSSLICVSIGSALMLVDSQLGSVLIAPNSPLCNCWLMVLIVSLFFWDN